jgi:hypothetical protein
MGDDDVYFTAHAASDEMVALVVQHELDILERCVQKCIDAGTCTFAATGCRFVPQTWFKCSCNSNPSDLEVANSGCGLCASCASSCHNGTGHELEQQEGMFYCDCGGGYNSGGQSGFAQPCQCNSTVRWIGREPGTRPNSSDSSSSSSGSTAGVGAHVGNNESKTRRIRRQRNNKEHELLRAENQVLQSSLTKQILTASALTSAGSCILVAASSEGFKHPSVLRTIKTVLLLWN